MQAVTIMAPPKAKSPTQSKPAKSLKPKIMATTAPKPAPEAIPNK